YLACHAAVPDPPAFPTRRSSDLSQARQKGAREEEGRLRLSPSGQVQALAPCGAGAFALSAEDVGECRATLRVLGAGDPPQHRDRSEEHTSELQSRRDLVCRLLLE